MTAWWFRPAPLARVAWLRTILYAFVWVDVLVTTPWVRDHRHVPGALYQPLAVARWLPIPTPTPAVINAVMVTLLVAAAVAATGRLPRAAGAAVAVLYLEWMLIAFSYGKVDHDRFGFLVALAVLPTVGRAAHHDRTPDDGAGWALRCIQVAVIATYFLAVLAKHRYGNGLLTWVDSTTLLRAVVRRGTAIADPLTEWPWVLHITQYALVAMELLSPLLLLPGRVGRRLVLGFLSFHAVTYACLTIVFLPHCMCLLAFLRVERMSELLRARHLAPRELLVDPRVTG